MQVHGEKNRSTQPIRLLHKNIMKPIQLIQRVAMIVDS